MLKKILKKFAKYKIQKQFNEIKKETIKYYSKKNCVDIPNFLQKRGESYAEKTANKVLYMLIKSPADISFYYKQLLEYRKRAA